VESKGGWGAGEAAAVLSDHTKHLNAISVQNANFLSVYTLGYKYLPMCLKGLNVILHLVLCERNSTRLSVSVASILSTLDALGCLLPTPLLPYAAALEGVAIRAPSVTCVLTWRVLTVYGRADAPIWFGVVT
jgi:hypothetical protein